MKESSVLQYYKNDYINAEKYCLEGNNNNATKEELDEIFISYMEYITAVVQHVVYQDELKNDFSSEKIGFMEKLNSKRTLAHNIAINKTISLNDELFKNGKIFDLGLLGKKGAKDLSGEERYEFGDFIFKMFTARSSVILDRKKEKEDKIFEESRKLSKEFKLKITENQQDVYNQIR